MEKGREEFEEETEPEEFNSEDSDEESEEESQDEPKREVSLGWNTEPSEESNFSIPPMSSEEIQEFNPRFQEQQREQISPFLETEIEPVRNLETEMTEASTQPSNQTISYDAPKNINTETQRSYEEQPIRETDRAMPNVTLTNPEQAILGHIINQQTINTQRFRQDFMEAQRPQKFQEEYYNKEIPREHQDSRPGFSKKRRFL